MAKQSLLPQPDNPARLAALILLVLAPFAVGLLALALGQDANWDLRNYHWYNAYSFVNGRFGKDFLPSQTPWFYNPALDIPFYLLASHVSARLAGFVLGFVQGFNFILLFMIAHATLVIEKPWRKFIVAAALAALGLLGGGGIALIGTTFYDNVTSLGTFLSALLVITQYERLTTGPWGRTFGLAVLVGLPAGLMMGLKLPCVIFCIGFCFSILFMGNRWRRQFVVSFGFGIGVLLGVAITLGYWAHFLQTQFGNPLFPYFNDFFKSPLAPTTSARDIQFVPYGFWNVALFPFRFATIPYIVGEISWRDWRIPILYALVPLAVIARMAFGRIGSKDQLAVPESSRYLLVAGTITYLLWLWMFAIYRYAIPLEMMAPLLIVLAVGLLPIRLKLRAVAAVLLLLVVTLSISPGNWTRRDHWLDRFVEASIPPIEPNGLMILMAGTDPYSHVLSEFPHQISFVRIQSNFSSPEEDKGINQLIAQRVRRHRGNFMLLIPPYQLDQAEKAMSFCGLKLAHRDEPCQTVVDSLYGDTLLSHCSVVRNKQN